MTPPAVPSRHWVIGDVHGCADALERLAALLPQRDRLVLCGDVINRGPQIERSMELAWGLVCCGRAVWLQGNHEASLVQALKQQGPGARETLAACETYRQLGDHRCRLWLERLEALPLIYRGAGWWPPTPASIPTAGSPRSRCGRRSGTPMTAASAM
ncbi:metallophosphoesterase [Cyanobium sp. LEGE 06113]|uniref:metallophosphoesterase n=1 Tax=Cyanobium sp. LEGE 06113 TaxID=1297573 RepID=UPI00351C1BBC